MRDHRSGAWPWALFDFGISAHNTIITTFVFAVYFTKQVAPDEATGTVLWGLLMALTALAVAVLSPVIAYAAERLGRVAQTMRVLWLFLFLATAGLFFVMPRTLYLSESLWLLGFGIVCFECLNSLYHGQLRGVADDAALGRTSGLGWAVGYVGGVLSLALALFVLVQPKPPLFGMDAALAEPVRATALLTALWLMFCLPQIFQRDTTQLSHGLDWRDGIALLRRAASDKIMRQFLLASALYRDGLNTLFAFGGIYAGTVHGFSFQQVIIFAIALNISAAVGAGIFGFVDDRLGSRRTIVLSLLGLIVFGMGVLFADSAATFWVAALLMGLFVGPLQAASRAYLTRLAPVDSAQSLFGLYNTTGKAAAFLGPMLYGAGLAATGTQQGGMAMVIAMWTVGFLILMKQKD